MSISFTVKPKRSNNFQEKGIIKHRYSTKQIPIKIIWFAHGVSF
jgi:hypothetical protein